MANESIEKHIIQYEEDENKQRHVSGQGAIGSTAYSVQGQCTETVGTDNADGTELISIDIPAGYTFVCTHIHFSCNEGRAISVATVNDGESLGHASEDVLLTFGSPNVGFHAITKEEQGVFKVTATSTQALDLKVFAEHTVYNETNDPATSYFSAYIFGLLFKSDVAVRGTS
jgi:hypothetical protein